MDQQNLQLNGGKGKKDRRELDFYPTPPEVTIALMRYLKLDTKYIWEPACGDGAMATVIESFGHKVFSSDLRDTGYGAGGIDYVNCDVNPIGVDGIITNPPFNLSDKFIEKSVLNFPIVAMLLKSQYWHAKKRFDLFTKYTPSYVLPLTWRPDFLSGERGGSPTMEVLWTVWIKGDTNCKYQPLIKP